MASEVQDVAHIEIAGVCPRDDVYFSVPVVVERSEHGELLLLADADFGKYSFIMSTCSVAMKRGTICVEQCCNYINECKIKR